MRSARFLLALLLPLGLEGCMLGRTASAYDVGASGLLRRDERLRTAFASGQVDTAFRLPSKELPDDALLRALYEGTIAYYGGRYEEGARLLDEASRLAEDRYTKSASRTVAAAITNDLALAYEPGRTERLFIHYYGALTYLARGDREGAAVEARRLALLLQQWDDVHRPGERQARALLRYFTGAVFEAAGEWNDAAVAYRNARALAPGMSFGDTTSFGLPVPAGADSGDVVLFVESGFVAHRVNQFLSFGITEGEAQALKGSDVATRLLAATGVSSRVLLGLAANDGEGLWWNGQRAVFVHTDGMPEGRGSVGGLDAADTVPDATGRRALGDPPRDSADAGRVRYARRADSASGRAPTGRAPQDGRPFWSVRIGLPDTLEERQRLAGDELRIAERLSVAWPVYRRPASHARPVVRLAEDTLQAPLAPVLRASVHDGVLEDYRRVRAQIVARAVVRLVAKEVAEQAAEGAAKKKWGETAGDVAGLLAGFVGTAMERADTRSWQLLPGGAQVLRLRLPAGRRTVVVEGGDGERREVAVEVRGGGTTIAATRVFGRAW